LISSQNKGPFWPAVVSRATMARNNLDHLSISGDCVSIDISDNSWQGHSARQVSRCHVLEIFTVYALSACPNMHEGNGPIHICILSEPVGMRRESGKTDHRLPDSVPNSFCCETFYFQLSSNPNMLTHSRLCQLNLLNLILL
jgi:hypothetical protein